jgi:hypothetical protein
MQTAIHYLRQDWPTKIGQLIRKALEPDRNSCSLRQPTAGASGTLSSTLTPGLK